MMPRHCAKSQPVSACSRRTARMPMATSSSMDIPRDSIPVCRLNLRGISEPNQSFGNSQFGRCTAIAEMPSDVDGVCLSIGCSEG